MRALLSRVHPVVTKCAFLMIWAVPTYAAVALFVTTTPSLAETALGVSARSTWGWMILIGSIVIWRSQPQSEDFRVGHLIRALTIVFAAEVALLVLLFSVVSGAAAIWVENVGEFLTLPLQIAIGVAAGLWLYDALRGK
jgi:hypothetical protein